MRRMWVHPSAWVGMARMALGGAAGCGSPTVSSPPPSSRGKTSTSPQGGKLFTVQIAQETHSLTDAPVVIAPAKGYFQQNGLLVKVAVLSGGTTADQALIGSSVLFDNSSGAGVLLADSHNADMIGIAAQENHTYWQVMVNKTYAKPMGFQRAWRRLQLWPSSMGPKSASPRRRPGRS